jgi:phosphohistidine swiveling domain-containing protein
VYFGGQTKMVVKPIAKLSEEASAVDDCRRGRDKAAAVVTDGGTFAAHASLVAREYGIPAVVGIGDATTRLSPGQLVTVDGAAGQIS